MAVLSAAEAARKRASTAIHAVSISPMVQASFDVAMVACSELVKSPRTGARMTALEASSVYDDNDTVSDEAQEASKVLKKASGWLKCLGSALGAIDDLAGMPDRITLQTIREANPSSPTGVKTAFRKSIRGIIASMADF